VLKYEDGFTSEKKEYDGPFCLKCRNKNLNSLAKNNAGLRTDEPCPNVELR
jgi:hypothetical protein